MLYRVKLSRKSFAAMQIRLQLVLSREISQIRCREHDPAKLSSSIWAHLLCKEDYAFSQLLLWWESPLCFQSLYLEGKVCYGKAQ